MRRLLQAQKLDDVIEIDSAGTHDYHLGDAPDKRSQQAALKRGVDLSGLRGRQVEPEDFECFDLILAMDKANLARLKRDSASQHQAKLGLFMDYAFNFEADEVPDPYYGAGQGFDLVLDMVEDAAQGLIDSLKKQSL